MDARELAERCRQGDTQAMAQLYTTYVRRLEQVSRKYVKDEAAVQDIVHDSFVVILTSLHRLKDSSRLESWMCTIVRNLSLKHLQQPLPASMEQMEVAEPTEEAVSQPDYDRLMNLVEELPTGYKNVLKLSVLEGLSHKEIGLLLGIEPHSSSSQLARAKEMLRKNAKRLGLATLALIAATLTLLLPEQEKPKDKLAEDDGDTPTTHEDVVQDTTEVETQPVALPTQPRRLVAQHIDTLAATDTTRHLVAEVTERDTTATLPNDTASTEPHIQPRKRLDNRLIADKKHSEHGKWRPQIGILFAGGSESRLLASAYLPGGSIVDKDEQQPDTIIDTRTRHHMPLSFGFTLSTPLSRRWSIGTGLRYTLLRTDITTTTTMSGQSTPRTVTTTTQKLHYIGIPLQLTCNLWNKRPISLYTTGGVVADIPVASHGPVQWSFTLGAGMQYRLTPSLSLYAEPNLNYYINHNTTPTIRTERPLEFTIPVGLRLNW